MASATDPTKWEDDDGTSPPEQWEAVDDDDRFWWDGVTQSPNPIRYIGTDPLPPILEFDWEIVSPPDAPSGLFFTYFLEGLGTTVVPLGSAVATGTIRVNTTGYTEGGSVWFKVSSTYGEDAYGGSVAVLGPSLDVSYNCDCDDETDYETLAQLRARLMVRLGYAGQVGNPPPGMAALLNDFLAGSQRLLYMKYTELRTERFFTWTMEPGVRFYDLPDNDEICTKELNALKLSWVGVEDLNGAWYPLISGIPPEMYTMRPSQLSLPQRYEIRQCIEVFPPPQEAYKLRIKGHMKLQAFTADADKTTIDSELVFLWALATAKAHYGHPDANNVAAMANDYLGRLVGGKHGTKRYVPGAVPLAPAVQPIMRDGYDA